LATPRDWRRAIQANCREIATRSEGTRVAMAPRVHSTFASSSRVALAFAFVLATAAAACGDAGTAGESAGNAESELFANDRAAYDYFVGKGLTSFQAAGIVGNLDQESGVNPGAVQYGGGPGRGIAQWSVGGRWDHDGGDNVVAYANQHGGSAWSL